LVKIYQAYDADLLFIHNYYIQYPDWDANQDGIVNDADVNAVSAKWGQTGEPHWIKEDLNWDGVINVGDLTLIGKHFGDPYTNPSTQDRLSIMNISFSTSEFERRADVDGNGVVNVNDENLIIQYATGQIDQFPVQNITEPVAEFTYPSNIRAGAETQFTDASSGNIVSWQWDFGDGSTSNIQNPIHIFTASGTYTVRLTVTDNFGRSDSVYHDIDVLGTTPPVAIITEDITGQLDCYLNVERVFDASSSYDPDGYITKYYWDFGDGTTYYTTTPTTTHTYTSTNEPYGYWLSLIVVDNDGLMDTDKSHVIVHVNQTNPPNAYFTYVINGMSVVFTDKSTPQDNIVSWSWSFGDGYTSNEQNPTHVYSNYGTYDVTLTITDKIGRSDTYTDTVTIAQPPPNYHTLTIVIDGKGTVTPNGGSYQDGATVTLTAIPDSGYKFDYWSGDLTGKTNPATVVMDGDKVITAYFVKETSKLWMVGVGGIVAVFGMIGIVWRKKWL